MYHVVIFKNEKIQMSVNCQKLHICSQKSETGNTVAQEIID